MAQRNYCFTINNPQEDIPVEFPEDVVRYAVYQAERGAEGTVHYQGYMELNKPVTVIGVKKWGDMWNRAHLERRMGTREQARNYCMKEDTRVSGPYEFGDFASGGKGTRSDLNEVRDAIMNGMTKEEVLMEYVDVIAKYPRLVDTCIQVSAKNRAQRIIDFEPRVWQESLIDRLSADPHPREIVWVYDGVGNTGKSYLSKYLVQEHGAFYCNGGKAADICYSYAGERIAIFDFVRDAKDYVNYGVIEQIKNGMMFSCKYESNMKVFNVPHVIVMANFMPDQAKMSIDRWNIIQI